MVKNANRYRWQVVGVAVLALAMGPIHESTNAQDAPVAVSAPAGRPMNAEQAKAMMEAQKAAAAQAGGQPGAQPTPEAKKDGEQKPAEGEKKEEAATTVKRPEKPPKVPDPNDFKVSVDETGRVPPFNFIGQPWPDVMQWLATNSKSSLDWQELPNDYLNLTTRRSYTIDEVRDLINSHLNARGFTAIQNGEMLRVFKIDKLDPSVVRRVAEEDLYDLAPYDFVKISFELPTGMEVEKAKEDVKQLLSPNAKVFPLVTTKRLLVMDSVANLRLVSALLNEERSVQDGRIVPDEIPLKHARAEKVIDILYVVLGLDPQSRPTQMELQLQQQKLQLMTQMQQQGKDVMSMLKKDGPPVYLAYNKQRNSIIANAPPEQMKIIHQTIKYLDVPFGDAATAEVGTAATGPVANGGRETRKYPLTTLDPDNFVMTLEEIGELNPSAEFRVDKKSKTLFATATESDHEKINTLIDQFDGSGREFHVIPLRRLPADAVAATIYNLMAGQQEEEEDNNRRPYWYYDPWEQNQDKDKPVQGFGVDADIENNRLMLWANEAEYQRVQDLLVKLGEIPNGQQDVRRVRFVQPGSSMPAAQLLEQIREAWSASGNNDLIINLPKKVEPETKEAETNEQETKPAEAVEAVKDRAASQPSAGRVRAQFVQLDTAEANALPSIPTEAPTAAGASSAETPAEKSPSDTAAELAKPAPVTINVTEDGRLMISSSDPVALDRMEELIGQLTPPEKRFKVYELKFVKAFDLYYIVKNLFKEEIESEEGGNDFFDYYFYGFRPRNNQDKGPSGLSKRRKLMVDYDPASNTILVANASPSQLSEIEALIAEYDKPVPADSVRTRRMALIKIKYSKASTIAQALKEVYVDLLSSKDKEFDRGGDQRQRGSSTERTTIIRYSDGSSGGNQRQSPVKVGFEGALSIGVDDISNTLLISVQEELYASVVGMVERLDTEAASDTVVRVHRVNGNVAAAALRETINGAVGQPWLGGKPDPNAARGRGGRDGRRDDGDRNRDRGRDRNRNRRDRDGDNNRNNGDNDNNNNDNDND
jgi:type II secretory pathway component GspD/PulD (secretin)